LFTYLEPLNLKIFPKQIQNNIHALINKEKEEVSIIYKKIFDLNYLHLPVLKTPKKVVYTDIEILKHKHLLFNISNMQEIYDLFDIEYIDSYYLDLKNK
jgi:hypothetical protein